MPDTYQAIEKLSVATYYCLDFQKLAHMEFHRWRRIANRYRRELDKMYDNALRDGYPWELALPLDKTRFYRKHATPLRRWESGEQ